MHIQKYLRVTTMQIQKHLTYRVRVFIWFLLDVSQFFLFPFVWIAILGNQNDIAGFNAADIVTYYVIILFISISTASHASGYIQRDIIRGKLNDYLIKPFQFLFFHYAAGWSYNIIAALISLPFIFGLGWIAPQLLQIPGLMTFPLFFISLLIAMGISMCLQGLVGISSFWFGENKALIQIRFVIEKLLGGEFAPIAFFPVTLQFAAALLPFRFLYDIPAQIFLQKIEPTESLLQLSIGIVWLIFLGLALRVVWHKGVRKYEGVGI